jgi:D-3-phosphoglycerate dehydrogenase / 2-oxoglutarate reductase
MGFKILISDPLSKDGLAVFEQAKGFDVDVNTGLPEEEIVKIIPKYDAIIVRSQTKVTEKIIEAGKNLKIIGRAGVGLDNVDRKAATQRGIIVMNVPGGNTVSTAELSFAMLLALSRNIPQANTSLRGGDWDRKTYKGVEVRGKTLGILGMGRIGTEVARRARAFEMKVIAYDPYLTDEQAKREGIEPKEKMEELLKESDYITIHTPLNDETRNMISTEQLAMMKPSARIINCARGGIVDEPALKKALDEGTIAGAAFDVYPVEPPEYRELVEHPKTVCTPHLGASTEEAQSIVAVDLAHQVIEALEGKGVRNAVNIPYVDPKVMADLAPYIQLGEKLGLLGAQMAKGPVVKMDIEYVGDVTDFDIGAVTVAILKGALTPHLDINVNYVNAPYIAKERGMTFKETKSSNESAYTNLIRVTFEAKEGSVQLRGTVFAANQDPRIVRIDNYHVDMKPFGRHLIVKNDDKAGTVGALGQAIGEANINIADMTLGRIQKGGLAVTVIAIDDPLPQDCLDKIKKIPQVKELMVVDLGD